MKALSTRTLLAACLIATFHVPGVTAQDADADLRAEIEQLKRGQERINSELQEIKKLLQARPAAAPAPAAAPSGPAVEGKVFDIGNNPVKGASEAKLTLVEFTDYQ